MEDDDQNGLAHFCEHMAFNGTKHFAKNTLIAVSYTHLDVYKRQILDNPNVQSFAESVIRLLGMSPHTLLKASPRGRDSLVRGCGTLQYEYVSQNSAKLHLRNFPASTFRSGTIVVLLSGTFLGLLDAAGVSRTAKLETTGVDLESGHATFVLHW